MDMDLHNELDYSLSDSMSLDDVSGNELEETPCLIIQEVLDKRVGEESGKVEYLLKCKKGYDPRTVKSWENEEIVKKNPSNRKMLADFQVEWEKMDVSFEEEEPSPTYSPIRRNFHFQGKSTATMPQQSRAISSTQHKNRPPRTPPKTTAVSPAPSKSSNATTPPKKAAPFSTPPSRPKSKDVALKIFRKRTDKSGNNTEYLVIWKKGDESYHMTWESEEHVRKDMSCRQLLVQFEGRQEQMEVGESEEADRGTFAIPAAPVKATPVPSGSGSSTVTSSPAKESTAAQAREKRATSIGEEITIHSVTDDDEAQLDDDKHYCVGKQGFERGLQAEKVLGATNLSGELLFIMKWKDDDLLDMVPNLQARLKCPQVVLDFYEQHLEFH